MSALLLPLILVATLVVILSGIWVTVALVHAIWHVDRPDSASAAETADENTP